MLFDCMLQLIQSLLTTLRSTMIIKRIQPPWIYRYLILLTCHHQGRNLTLRHFNNTSTVTKHVHPLKSGLLG